jgi:hypothetical protein
MKSVNICVSNEYSTASSQTTRLKTMAEISPDEMSMPPPPAVFQAFLLYKSNPLLTQKRSMEFSAFFIWIRATA